ncbi:MAG: GNAT family N-acetyltransferase [Chitinophagaceae bacterium]|nr:GNAT family N-acetyltransferase [Chitinophagaceae bacterium]
MITIRRTDSKDRDFHFLVDKLNKDLLERYGELQVFYNQFNKIENIPSVVVAYIDSKPVGCGCFKRFNDSSVEIKRMYAAEEQRGKGIGGTILNELEKWAAELGNQYTVLEMGNNQPEAAHLYKSRGYRIIPNYGQYIGMEATSICMKKDLNL